MSFVKIKNISMKYQHDYILHHLNLQINQDEILVLLGESGSGKSTLLKIICGLITPETGTIEFEGKNITTLSPQYRNIGYVPQAQVLFPHMKIIENLKFGLITRKLSENIINQRIKKYGNLTQISHLFNRYPREMSGGQKQRVALARALIVEPVLLLLDEPLSSIDFSGREKLALIIRRIQQKTGTPILYVTHNQQEAQLIGDRIAIIFNGQIQQIGTYREIHNTPRSFQIAKVIGLPNIWPITKSSFDPNQNSVFSPIGQVSLGHKSIEEVSGIYVSPNDIVIKTSFDLQKDLEKTDMLQKIGRYNSSRILTDDLYQILIDLRWQGKIINLKVNLHKNRLKDIIKREISEIEVLIPYDKINFL